MTLRGITIDLWNTLIDSSNGDERRRVRIEAIRPLLATKNLVRSDAEIEAALGGVYPEFQRIWKESQRTMTTSEMVSNIFQRLGIVADGEELARVTRVFERSILDGPPRLLPGAHEALNALASRYSLALISDTAFSPGSVLRELLAHYGIDRLFKTLVFSDETGVSKPHPKAYRVALEAIACDASEAVHVGDIEWTDIAGAKAFGMKSILFRGDGKSMFASDPSQTQADAVAMNWGEALAIIERWERM